MLETLDGCIVAYDPLHGYDKIGRLRPDEDDVNDPICGHPLEDRGGWYMIDRVTLLDMDLNYDYSFDVSSLLFLVTILRGICLDTQCVSLTRLYVCIL